MATAFWLYYFIKNTIGRGIWGLLVAWVSMEYFHLNWDLSWPWLTLGNGFANIPSIVQWYEFTGVLGGSLWILLTNFFIFKIDISRNYFSYNISFCKYSCNFLIFDNYNT